MEPVKLTPDQYAMIVRIIRTTHTDYTHAERILKEVDWDEQKAIEQVTREKSDFVEGKIRFGPGKEVLPT